ncbi:uncharacterized protein LOC110253203 [Exaiptasia diaphana]|uniref:Uncharacterized protein n=1 Tax=Exaiptasia diaphana TaxID=2652724 RepID=A0A913Y715_EXADI|nr:uncharacterized protein LOC110253203 [Exaiptasia diaphana]
MEPWKSTILVILGVCLNSAALSRNEDETLQELKMSNSDLCERPPKRLYERPPKRLYEGPLQRLYVKSTDISKKWAKTIYENNKNHPCADIKHETDRKTGQQYFIMRCKYIVDHGCRFTFNRPACVENISSIAGKTVLTGCECTRKL